jgi:hypothetical protein
MKLPQQAEGYKSGIRRSLPAFPSSVAGYCGGRALFELWRVATPFYRVVAESEDRSSLQQATGFSGEGE